MAIDGCVYSVNRAREKIGEIKYLPVAACAVDLDPKGPWDLGRGEGDFCLLRCVRACGDTDVLCRQMAC